MFEDKFWEGVGKAKIGTILRIRYPKDYVVSDGPGIGLDMSPCERTVVLSSWNLPLGWSDWYAHGDELV